MNQPQHQSSTQKAFDEGFQLLKRPLSDTLQNALMPLFKAGISKKNVPALWGTAFCVEYDGYRLLATAKHVIDELQGDLCVRNDLNEVVQLDEFQRIDIPDSDIAFLEVGFSHVCKHLHTLDVVTGLSLVPKPQELTYIEGFPSTKNKLPHIMGLRPMGFPAVCIHREDVSKSLRLEIESEDCWFKLVRTNCIDQAGNDANLPIPNGMSGSPVFILGSVACIAQKQSTDPTLIGVFTRAHKREKVGAFALLQPAVLSAVEALNNSRTTYRLRDIRRKKAAISNLLNEYNVTDLRVFGSVARYEAKPDSDVDLVAKFNRGYDVLRNRIPLTQKLAELLGSKVDLIPEHELNFEMREKVLREALPL